MSERPSDRLKPEMVLVEEGKWFAVYDDVIGGGATPEMACLDFDAVWLTGKPGPLDEERLPKLSARAEKDREWRGRSH